MENKELLELAAKAAGIELASWDEQGGQWIRSVDDPSKVEQTGNGWGAAIFDPLDDDGDALRLAVKLGLDILQYQEPDEVNSVEVIANDNRFGDFKPWASEPLLKDACAATRRAIVRAAANVGKAMR